MDFKILLSTFVTAVHDIEALMPDSPGKEKFDAVITLVQAVVGDVGPLVPVLLNIATNLVNGLKAAGIFKSKTTA